MKKIMTTICAALVFCFVLSGTVAEAKTDVYQQHYTKDYREIWSDGVTKVYMNKARTKLCEKNIKSGKVTVLKKLKATEENYYTIVNVYNNRIYLNHINYLSSDAYVYNKTTKKFKRLKKDLRITDAYGSSMLTMGYVPSDISPYTAWIYKVSGDGIKKVKTIGNAVAGMKICDGKIYYASYTKTDGSSNENMKVYTCDLSGQNKKFLFSKKAEGEYGYALVEEFSAESILFMEYNSDTDSSTEYIYDIASGKIQEVSK